MKIIGYLLTFIIGLLIGKFFFERWGWLNYQIVEVKELTFADSGVYQGTIKDNLADGKGTIKWGNGNQYTGQFEKGLMSGQGELTLADGSKYIGSFFDGLEHGVGEIIYSNGTQYQGEFAKGNMEGKGVYSDNYGTDYKGAFKNGVFDGYGVLKSADGSQYIGNFEDGDFNGDGNFIYADGDAYLGEFKAGKFEGYGSYQLVSGDRYVGNFIAGNLEGNGEYFGTNGDHYIGNFNNWNYQGQGVLNQHDGESYTGEFLNGFYHGQGKLTQVDGSSYEGEFVGGLPNGQGVYTQKDGVAYEGQWLNSELQNDKLQIKIGKKREISETILNEHGLILRQAGEKIKAGIDGKVEYFTLLIAGDGSQRVFEKEVETISQYFDQDHSMLLVNQQQYDGKYPMATVASLDVALQAIAKKMNPEDILFLYMTSHGSPSGAFTIEKKPFELKSIYHRNLAEILQRSTITNRIIFVSSCYSGTYIPYLKDETTTVITAASATTTSFGCSNDSDMTWFAKAFFEDLDEDTVDLKLQFDKAVKKVKQWEAEQEFEFSNPQIWIGKKAPKTLPIIVQ